jgi:hypothetical protein
MKFEKIQQSYQSETFIKSFSPQSIYLITIGLCIITYMRYSYYLFADFCYST